MSRRQLHDLVVVVLWFGLIAGYYAVDGYQWDRWWLLVMLAAAFLIAFAFDFRDIRSAWRRRRAGTEPTDGE